MIDLRTGVSALDTVAAGRLHIEKAPRSATAAETGAGHDFSALIGDAIEGLSSRLRKSEAVSVAGLKGTASTHDVVEQLMVAEHSLQAAIAVRDKIVAAYLEIGRMAI